MSAYDRKRCLRPAGNGGNERGKKGSELASFVRYILPVVGPRIFPRYNFSLVSLARDIARHSKLYRVDKRRVVIARRDVVVMAKIAGLASIMWVEAIRGENKKKRVQRGFREKGGRYDEFAASNPASLSLFLFPLPFSLPLFAFNICLTFFLHAGT